MQPAHAALRARDLDPLRRSFGGDIVTPADGGYDEARRLWDSLYDHRPALVVRPTDAGEVAVAIRFARERGLELAVRSGGHSAAGHSGCDGGMVVDMSAMRGVEVDPASRTARANGGALLAQLDVAAQAHGLVCPVGVIGHTGVAGLTLGGGIGRLQRQFGLTIDNLLAVELVTADGRPVRASETEEPDLFWGLRGAGWNFGIATAFEFRLSPFGPDLHRGVLVFGASDALAAWAMFRDYARRAPETVSVIFGIDLAGPGLNVPDHLAGRPIAYVAYNHSGAADDVERDTAGLRAGPSPVSTIVGSRRYLEVQTANDELMGGGRRVFIRGCNAHDVRPGALEQVIELVASAPGEGAFSITALGGAIGRVPDDATAYTGRTAAYDVSAEITWDDPALDQACCDWVRRVMAAVEPEPGLGRYANENADTGPEETRRIFGDAKLARLARLKRAWDPDNVFHLNHNVAPAPGP